MSTRRNRHHEKSGAAADIGATSAERLSQAEEAHFVASQWQLIWRKFRRHRLARLGAAVITILVVLAIFAEFWSPYGIYERHTELVHLPPQQVRVWHAGKLHRPFVYGVTSERSTTTFFLEFSEDRSLLYPLRFFVRGTDYKIFAPHSQQYSLLRGRRARSDPPVGYREYRQGYAVPNSLGHSHIPERRPGRYRHQFLSGLSPGRCIRLLRRSARHDYPADHRVSPEHPTDPAVDGR